MPGRWESSGRPLFVRTVWIKGIRHVVLSKNDPLLQQMVQDISFPTPPSLPYPETTPSTTTTSPTSVSPMTSDALSALSLSSTEALPESIIDECLAKLRGERGCRAQIEKNTSEERDLCKNGRDQKCASRRKDEGSGKVKNRKLFMPIDDTTVLSDQNIGNIIRLEQNPLSDRVMKWLDLSGKSLLETTMVNDKSDLETSREGKKPRGGRHVKKYMKHRSASLNIINTQYDMTLTADIRIEGNPQHQQLVRFEHAKPEKEFSAKMNKMYELKRSNSVISLSLSPENMETLRPTTTDGAPISAKTKLHIFVPLIRENDSLSEDNEEYF